jgi:hypothetical protein
MLSGCAGSRTSTCESLYDNQCDQGCTCPADLICRVYSDGYETSGRNACFRDCAQNSDCSEGTWCIEVPTLSADHPNEVVVGECWPECKGGSCPAGTRCQATRLYADGRALKACF